MFRQAILTLAALLVITTAAPAQCGKVCGAPGAYAWQSVPDAPDQAALYQHGRQLGNWSHDERVYRPFRDGLWGVPCEPPIPPPPAPPEFRRQQSFAQSDAADSPPKNYGVDLSKVGSGYRLNGKPCSRATAHQAVERGIPDDAHKLRLTVIGPDADRKRFLDALTSTPEGAALLADAVLWSVPPDHWSLRDNVTGAPMFVTTGKPTIYLQDAAGRVLHRQDDYRGPSDIQAIRKAASYDPAKDPDARRGNPLSGLFGNVPLGVWLLGGALALALFLRK